MPNPDRADIRPEIQHASWFPREFRGPVLSSRFWLATFVGSVGVPPLGVEVFQVLSGNTPTAEAAEACRIQLAFHAFNYIDMYPINGLGRPGKIDSTEDPKIGPAVNAAVEVLDQKNGQVIAAAQLFRRPIPQDLRARILTNEFDRNNSNLKEEGYAETPVLNLDCNKPNSQVEVFIRSSQNPSDQEPRIVKNGEKFHDLLGRQEKTNEAARRAVRAFLMENDPRRTQIEDSLRVSTAPSPTAAAAATPTAIPRSVAGGQQDFAGLVGEKANAVRQGVTENLGGALPWVVGAAALLLAAAYRRFAPAHLVIRGRRII